MSTRTKEKVIKLLKKHFPQVSEKLALSMDYNTKLANIACDHKDVNAIPLQCWQSIQALFNAKRGIIADKILIHTINDVIDDICKGITEEELSRDR